MAKEIKYGVEARKALEAGKSNLCVDATLLLVVSSIIDTIFMRHYTCYKTYSKPSESEYNHGI